MAEKGILTNKTGAPAPIRWLKYTALISVLIKTFYMKFCFNTSLKYDTALLKFD